MNPSWHLAGFVLPLVLLVSSSPAAASNPLDGKVFRSVGHLPGGEKRDGTVTWIYWKLRFEGTSFQWWRTDVGIPGTYTYDASSGALVIKNSTLKAYFDAKTGVLTWDNQKYVAVKEGKK